MPEMQMAAGSPEPENECPICLGMGYICKNCRNPDGECTCEDGPDLIQCPKGCV